MSSINYDDIKIDDEKNSDTNVIKDFGFIKIRDKFYEVNQNKASLNIIKSSLTLSNFFREYGSIIKTIGVYNNAKDDLLKKGYSENFDDEVAKFEKSIEKEKEKFNKLLEQTDISLKNLLIFYLGKDVMENELADISFIDSIKICTELSSQSTDSKINNHTEKLGV